MSKDPLGLPPVLAAPPRDARHRRIIVAVAAHLAVILGTAGVITLIQARAAAGRPSVTMVATLTSPGDGALAAFSPKRQAAGHQWRYHQRLPVGYRYQAPHR